MMNYIIYEFYISLKLRWRVISLMSSERSLYFFYFRIVEKFMKFYSWIQLAIVHLHINFLYK